MGPPGSGLIFPQIRPSTEDLRPEADLGTLGPVESPPASCHHQPACPGCPRFGQSGIGESAQAALSELAERWGVHPKAVADVSGLGSRHRARLSVRPGPTGIRIGIFEARSHRLVHIPDCPLHHPSITALLHRILELDAQHPIEAYREESHAGLLRALQLAVEPSSGKVQIVFLVRDALDPGHQVENQLRPILAALKEEEFTHSLWLGSLPERNNSLFPKRLEHIAGPTAFTDECAGARTFFPPDAFGQANPALHRRAVEAIHQYSFGPRTVEYYAGVGTIGLGLVALGQEVLFNEVGPGSLTGLRRGLAEQHASSGQTHVLEGAAGEHAEAFKSGDTVIVDPPRKGLDGNLFRRLLESPPHRLIYLSCGLSSLLRESEKLRASGSFRMIHLSAYNYFPFTEHVETLAIWQGTAPHAGSTSLAVPAGPA
jgi:23S rRNA (uracil1939-C5)-methyltransferase